VPETYVVQPKDTLYSIAWRHDVDFKDLAAWNNLGASMRIETGQILTLSPAHALKTPGPAPNVHREIPRVDKPKPLPGLAAQGSSPAVAAVGLPLPQEAWVWPTRATGSATPVAGGGILIPGGLGQDVLAAAAGKVVYVGSGLRGYGNLVIVKHSESLLSAYAHNQSLGVREGQLLKAGERIGAMGLGPRQLPSLYFEIRVNGKPVNVAQFLRKK
jgi:lipoprotein NlpD